jgi:hypothetical protein
MRLAGAKALTREMADCPTLFAESRQSKTNYLAVPRAFSGRRVFIPIAYASSDLIAGDKLQTKPDASFCEFGVIASAMYMGWIRTTAGRLKSDFQYSANITYNNFPWPVIASEARQSTANVTGLPNHDAPRKEKHIAAIETAAQAVLDARAAHPKASLADLYDPFTMPANLLKSTSGVGQSRRCSLWL